MFGAGRHASLRLFMNAIRAGAGQAAEQRSLLPARTERASKIPAVDRGNFRRAHRPPGAARHGRLPKVPVLHPRGADPAGSALGTRGEEAFQLRALPSMPRAFMNNQSEE